MAVSVLEWRQTLAVIGVKFYSHQSDVVFVKDKINVLMTKTE